MFKGVCGRLSVAILGEISAGTFNLLDELLNASLEKSVHDFLEKIAHDIPNKNL